MPQDKLHSLHKLLVKKGIDNKSFEEFQDNFSGNEEKQRKLHSVLVKNNIDNKSFEEFQNNFFSQKKSLGGTPSGDSSSSQQNAPVVDQSYSWSAGSKTSDLSGDTMRGAESGSPEIIPDTSEVIETSERTVSLSRVRQSRKGDYQSDAVERFERGVSDYDKDRLAQRTPLEKMFNTDITSKQFKAHTAALSADQQDLGNAVDALESQIRQELGETSFEQFDQDNADLNTLMGEYNLAQSSNSPFSQDKIDRINELTESVNNFVENPLVQERNQMIGAMNKNVKKFKEIQEGESYAGVREMIKAAEEIQKQTDAQSGGMVSNIVVKSLAKMVAGVGRFTENIDEVTGSNESNYGPIDAVQNFLIDLGTDAEMMFPSPSQFSRQLLTSTAQWNGYEADVSGDNITLYKNGEIQDVELSNSEREEIMALPRESQWNLSGAPYQVGQVVADMAVMLAGADKISKGLTAVGVGRNVAAKTGVTLSTAGQMSEQLYRDGLEMFNGDEKKAAQYSIFGGLSIGAVSNIFGLEAKLIGGGTSKAAVNALKMTPKQMAARAVVNMLKEGVGEGFEESILENSALALVSASLGGPVDLPNKEEIISEGVMGFAIGTLFAGGNINQDINRMQMSSLLAASKNPELYGQVLRREIEAGRVKGDEEFIAREVGRATKIGQEMDKLSDDLKPGSEVEAVGLINAQIEAQSKLDSVKGNEPLEVKYQQQLDAVNAQLNKLIKDVPEVVEEKSTNVDKSVEKSQEKPEEQAPTEVDNVVKNEPMVNQGSVKEDEKPDNRPLKTKMSSLVNRTIEDDIAQDLVDGRKLKPESFDRVGDPNSRKGAPTLRYIDKNGDNLDTWAQELADKYGIDEKDAEQMIIDMINDNPSGLEDYVNRRVQEDSELEIGFDNQVNEIIETVPEEEAEILEEWLSDFEMDGEVDFDAVQNAIEDAESGFDPEILELQQKAPAAYKNLLNTINEKIQETEGANEASGSQEPPEPEIDENKAAGIARGGGFADELFAVVGLKNPEKSVNWMRKFFKKTFTSSGLLPSTVFERDVKRRAAINANMKKVSNTNRKLQKQLKEEYGKKVPTNIVSAMNTVLKGGKTNENLSNEVLEIIAEMRGFVDNMSRDLMVAGVSSGKLNAIIEKNMETYLNRSYAVHDDPDWVSKVKMDASVWNRARNFVSGQIQKQIAEIDGKIARSRSPARAATLRRQKRSYEQKLANLDAYLEATLKEQQDKSSAVNQGQGGQKLGSKSLGIFKKRKDIPVEIRKLFGEYEDPILNFSKSIFKMASLLENHKFLNEVRLSAEDVFLFTEPRDGYTSKIAADESSTMAPLNGMYTSEEIKQAFEEFGKMGEIPDWIFPVVWMASKAKYAKTILSPITHIRNFIFNIGFHWANGHMGGGIDNLVEAAKITLSDLGTGKRDEEFEELVRLGVVYDSSTLREMMELIKDTDSRFDKMFSKTAMAEKLKVVTKTAEKLYQAEDDYHKVVAFFVERDRYSKAWYGKKFDDLDWKEQRRVKDRAAKIVRNTLPTYSMVSENMQKLRRIPVTGTFISFPYEVMRTTMNTMNLAREEFADPATRSIGIKRILGVTSLFTSVAAISKMAHAMVGMDDEDEDAIRDFIAPWSEDSILIPIEKVGPNFTYIDVTSVLPQGYLMEFFNAALDDRKGAGERFSSMMYRMTEPFLGWDMTYKRLNEAINNKTETGKTIAVQDLPLRDRVNDTMWYLSELFTPGAVTTGERIYKSFTQPELADNRKLNPKYEVAALLSGIRVSVTNLETSFKYRSRDFSQRHDDITWIYRSELRKENPGDLDAAKEKAYSAYQNMFKELRRMYHNGIKLGADPANMNEHLKFLNKEERKYLKADKTPPIQILDPKK